MLATSWLAWASTTSDWGALQVWLRLQRMEERSKTAIPSAAVPSPVAEAVL
jgi:hypothetical protein